MKLLLSNKAHDQRTFQLKDKGLISHLSPLLRCAADDLAMHLEQSGCVGVTAEHYFTDLSITPPTTRLCLGDVDGFLDRLAAASSDTHALLRWVLARCTGPELRVILRIVTKDLRLNAGSAIVLKVLAAH